MLGTCCIDAGRDCSYEMQQQQKKKGGHLGPPIHRKQEPLPPPFFFPRAHSSRPTFTSTQQTNECDAVLPPALSPRRRSVQ